MARRRKTDAMDMGTPELARKFTVVPKLSSPTETSMKVLDGNEIDRLLLHDLITPAQHGTLNNLARRLHSFGFIGLKSPDYASRIHADAELVADKKAETIRGAVSLIKKMDGHPSIGRGRREKLVNMVVHDAPWGKLRHQVEDLHHCIRALDDIFLGVRG